MCSLLIVSRNMNAEVSANKIGVTGYLMTEKMPSKANMKTVTLSGEPCGIPFSCVWMMERWPATLTRNFRSVK